ncbi:MAG: diacylglycerol kinase family lipid kinase [candidate division KSB1 bacterium]|nr:diacylglycerol kinase family lipid kinase [candidate division KSB1 bacterium]MDZ7305095.1 diacylglycerol kinase family lipid kinase [candidate division KSB1 bacterium]MDZ7313412.1 diacylglycerol kinase family lipid kinase [candidate division KSB1 bacterium]
MPDNFKTTIIVNPASASGQTSQMWPVLKELLEAERLAFDLTPTTGPGTATELARKALHEGYEMIVAVGGDGTINEIINGFFEDGKPINPQAVLGILCVGTGGDFIKTMQIPREPKAAVERLLGKSAKTIDVGKCIFIDHLGKQVSRFFVNIADIGVGGETVERINRRTGKTTGKLAYFWCSLVSLIQYKNKKMRIRIDDHFDEERVVSLLVVANGQFFGGGMRIAPEAKLDDHLFDVVIVGDIGTMTFLANLQKLYAGTILTHPKVQLLRGNYVTVDSAERALLDLDGEQPGVAPVEFTLIPAALRVKI